MDAQLAVAAVILHERLEKLRPPRPVQHMWGGPGEDLGHRAVLVGHHARIAEDPPGQRHRRCVWQGRQKRRNRPVADMHIDKFVDVQRQHPVRPRDQWMPVRLLQCCPLRALAMRSGIAEMGQPAQLLQPVQHRIRAVVAIVGKDKKIRDPAGPVMRQPFQKERPLVPHAKDGRDLHPARPFIFAKIFPPEAFRAPKPAPRAEGLARGWDQKKACRPVIARPRISACTSCVPS